MMENHPYLPNTAADRAEMLRVIGVRTFDDLVTDIPREAYRPKLELPSALSEPELQTHLAELASKNRDVVQNACFLGGGARHHYIPSTIKALISRGEFLTSYTPYQPEVAQGTLQSGFDFQTLICNLFDMEVANLGMYDGVTAFAEAVLMACRIKKSTKIAILDTVDARMIEVLQTYTRWQDIELIKLSPSADKLPEGVAAVALQSPNVVGGIEDVQKWTDLAHAGGALSIVQCDPFASVMFNTPGEMGVDIVTAEGQPLGVPLSFGGAYVGLFACKKDHIRQMPGRIVGMTEDAEGRPAYVLTLQTREQHIRRERATSNICTSTQLIALMVTIYLATMGPHNLAQVADTCYQQAHYAAKRIGELDGYSLLTDGHFFNEFAVKCPIAPAKLNDFLMENGVIGGLDLSHYADGAMLFAVTEMNDRAQIDKLVELLGKAQKQL